MSYSRADPIVTLLLKSFLLDISPLRASREYRLLFFGQVVSLVGRQVTIVASSIQIFDITGETLAVGLLGLAQFPAVFLGSFVGGTFADAYDRRRILIVSQVLMALTTVGLALNAMASSPAAWLVIALMMINAFLSSIDSPSRSASVPKIVPAAILPAAFALQVVMWEVAATVGPAVGGVVIARSGLATAYWLDTATFGAALGTLLLMKPLLPAGGGTRPGLRSIGEGIRFIRKSKPLQGIFVIDIAAMVLAAPTALFPEWGTEILGGDEATVGLLFAAPAGGAFIAGMLSGRLSKLTSSGIATVTSVVIWGVSIAAFGFTRSLVFAVITLSMAGAADAMSAVFRNTILQLSTPDRLRGRLSAVQIAVVSGGPRVGDARAGAVASLTTPQIAAWSGGLTAIVGGLLVARAIPEFARWKMPTDVDMER